MAVNNFCLCVTCDTEFEFPALDSDQNCPGSPALSQVAGIVILPDGVDAPLDWTDKTEWDDIVDNADTTNSNAKYLAGVGAVDTPEKTTVTVAKGQILTTIRLYTLQLDVYNLSDTNREFLRQLQCGPTSFTFWIENIGSHFFGGSAGITPFYTDVDFPLGAGDQDVEKATLTIQWRAKCDPERAYIENLSENFSGSPSGSRIMGFSTTEVFGNTTAQVHGY